MRWLRFKFSVETVGFFYKICQVKFYNCLWLSLKNYIEVFCLELDFLIIFVNVKLESNIFILERKLYIREEVFEILKYKVDIKRFQEKMNVVSNGVIFDQIVGYLYDDILSSSYKRCF